MPLPFSSDFGAIVKIAVIYIKDEDYSFLSWMGALPYGEFLLVVGSLA